MDTPSFSRKHTTMTKKREEQKNMRMGEVFRARLTGAAVAQTLVFEEVFNFQPDVPVHLDRKILLSSFKCAPRGFSSGPEDA